MKDILTTTDVAKLLGLHANTLKNWVREGKLPSFRTLGGHYRIRAIELVEALREKGIPIPEELLGGLRRVFIVHSEDDVRKGIEKELKSAGQIKVDCFGNGAEALLAAGSCAPQAMVWYVNMKDVDAVSAARALLQREQTKNIALLLLDDDGPAATRLLPDDLHAVPVYSYPGQMPDMLVKLKEAEKR
jgi:excisionase family DNA binding protein